MLILTRRIGESITIETPEGEQNQVVAQSLKDNQVRVGVDAPTDMLILREELVGQSETGELTG